MCKNKYITSMTWNILGVKSFKFFCCKIAIFETNNILMACTLYTKLPFSNVHAAGNNLYLIRYLLIFFPQKSII